jgi:hypothetical protein
VQVDILRNCSRQAYCFIYFSDDRSYNFRARTKGGMFCCMGLLFPLLLAVNLLISTASRDLLESLLGKAGTDTLMLYLVSVHVL